MEISVKIKEKLVNWRKKEEISSLTKIMGTFQSSDEKTDIQYLYICPPTKPKMVLQFVHGMGEYIDRYIDFGEFLANEGIAFFISDNLGHGKSIIDDSDLGYFGDWKYLIYDTKKLTDIAKETFPDIPFILGGHSMGSFICRAYLEMYPNETKNAILVGTGNSDAKVSSGYLIARFIGKLKGEKHRSQFLQFLSFGPYNKKIENPKTVYDWLSINEDNVRKYMGDPLCGFTFTADGFAALSKLMTFVTKDSTISRYNKDLSILLLGGKDDPVSNYGSHIYDLEEKMRNLGINKLDVRIYPNMRHEILQETNKEDVYQDILNWLKEIN